MKPKVAPSPVASVVVCVFNMATLLPKQVDAILRQQTSYPFELVIVDNGSTDGSRAIAQRYAERESRVRLVNASPQGLNVARNAGVRAARSSVVALCDADDEVAPGWLAALVDSYQDGCYLGGALLVGGVNSAQERRRWGLSPEAGPRVPNVVLGGVSTPVGASCCFGKDMWIQLGGFNEALSGAGDETEFFYRAGLRGYRYVGVPDSVVKYRLPADARGAWRRGYRYGLQKMYAREYVGDVETPGAWQLARQWLWLARELPIVLMRRRAFYAWLDLGGRRTGYLAYRLAHLRSGANST